METFFILFGFALASYSIVANDAIQTLGTFISSNEKNPWWILWLYAGTILTVVLLYGYFMYDGDVSYGRLAQVPVPASIQWWHALPPVFLLLLTHWGIPVSTTFLVLSVFSPGLLIGKIIVKSLVGYGVAFLAAIIFWMVISQIFEKRFIHHKPLSISRKWVVGQWLSTGFLWSQWLIQDLANIFVFMPRQMTLGPLLGCLALMLVMLGFIFRSKGGKIQNIVSTKQNTTDLRSATLIDLIYGIILFVFTEVNNLPMSTTWVFLGLLAGREYAINHQLQLAHIRCTFKMTMGDFSKATVGLIVSLIVAFSIQEIGGGGSIKTSDPKQIEKPAPRTSLYYRQEYQKSSSQFAEYEKLVESQTNP